MVKKAVQRGHSEVHGAKNNERHAWRRRDGEPAVSRAEASRSYPPAPRLMGQTLFPWPYVEGLINARRKLADFFSILLGAGKRQWTGRLGCGESGMGNPVGAVVTQGFKTARHILE